MRSRLCFSIKPNRQWTSTDIIKQVKIHGDVAANYLSPGGVFKAFNKELILLVTQIHK